MLGEEILLSDLATLGSDRESHVDCRTAHDGSIYLSSRLPLVPPAKSITQMFDLVAETYPDRPFLKQRCPSTGGWREISYGQAQRDSRAIAQWLLDQGIRPGETFAILSGPSIEHAVLAIGVQRARIASAPFSAAYSLRDKSLAKLAGCMDRTQARVAFADGASQFADAIRFLDERGVQVIVTRGEVEGVSLTQYADVISTVPTEAVDTETRRITPDTITRIMHTSGSTGSPKAAPLPQANLTLTVAQCESVGLLNLGSDQPQFLESMPFSHIMGGNYNFYNMIRMGAVTYLDEGKPTPELFGQTLANLREVSPHIFHTVPAGFTMLCNALETDVDLRKRFFRNLVYMGCGGAALTDSVVNRLKAMSRAELGREIPIYGFYGATEYSLGTVRYWTSDRMDVIGLPLPATELKLVPTESKYELRIRSGTLMPRSGYLGNPEASNDLFDEEGFFRTGDAAKFLDPERPQDGLVFDGRIAEEFKLATATWVSVGALRTDLLSSSGPLIKDVVICGINQPYIGTLIWLDEDIARASLEQDGAGLSAEQLVRHPDIVERIRNAIQRFNSENPGGSRAVRRVRLIAEPLSETAGELTEKGSVNQRRVRETRAAEIMKLFEENNAENLQF